VRLLDVAETAELNAVAFVEVGRLIIIHASRGCEHTKFLGRSTAYAPNPV
jgi:hypothetical protein